MSAPDSPLPCPLCQTEMVKNGDGYRAVWEHALIPHNGFDPGECFLANTRIAGHSLVRIAAWNRRAEPPVHAANLLPEVAAALRALLDAEALAEIEPIVAGWNGPPEAPYGRHPETALAEIPMTCGAVYALADALAAARAALAKADAS